MARLDRLVQAAVQRGTGWTEFEHIAEHRNAPATRADSGPAKHVERRGHRRRIGVIAFIDQGGLAVGKLKHAAGAAAGRRLDLRQRQCRTREIGARKRGGRQHGKRIHRHVPAGHAELVGDIVP